MLKPGAKILNHNTLKSLYKQDTSTKKCAVIDNFS